MAAYHDLYLMSVVKVRVLRFVLCKAAYKGWNVFSTAEVGDGPVAKGLSTDGAALLMVIVSSLFPPSTSYNTFLVNSQSAPSVGQHFEICTRRILVVNLTNCRAYPPSSLPPLTYVHPPL